MSAEVLPFPTPLRAMPGGSPHGPSRVGDLVILCLNTTIGLWSAWPIAAVDDDGFVMGVTAPNGATKCIGRLCANPECYRIAADGIAALRFATLCWKTWPTSQAALAEFAAAEKARSG